jgi:hypothetical protein
MTMASALLARARRGLRRYCAILGTVAVAGGAPAAPAATPPYPPAGDMPFGSLSVATVEGGCTGKPGCTAECGAPPLGGVTILGSHLRGTGGPFAILSVATGFGLVINESTGEREYTIGGTATLVFASPAGGTIAFSAVAGTPPIGSSFPFTVKSASADGGFAFAYVVDFPDCPLTLEGSYR